MWTIIIIVAIIIFIIVINSPSVPKIKIVDEDKETSKTKREEYINRYGTPTKEISWRYFMSDTDEITDKTKNVTIYDKAGTFFCFEDERILIINDDIYSFSEIIGYELIEDNQIVYSSKTKTSTGSMVGRAIVGGAIMGGIGAVIGGSTAKSETSTSSEVKSSKYSIRLNLDNIKTPLMVIDFYTYVEAATEALYLLNTIVNRNK